MTLRKTGVQKVQILFNDKSSEILDGSPTANQISQNIDQTPLISSQETPFTLTNTPYSSFDKKYPDCIAKMNVINE